MKILLGHFVIIVLRQFTAKKKRKEYRVVLVQFASEHAFIALECHSEMIMGFHEHTYQDLEDIIRPMNTKHAQCMLALCHSEHVCDQVP